ncbi:MAG: hypothetical protein LBM12_00320 [Candidatus Nomurabacteria bacterium]|jgi:hypothetical protein|nr:hypothetical protein [Candidatus Nomurabacteria bacterium]
MSRFFRDFFGKITIWERKTQAFKGWGGRFDFCELYCGIVFWERGMDGWGGGAVGRWGVVECWGGAY